MSIYPLLGCRSSDSYSSCCCLSSGCSVLHPDGAEGRACHGLPAASEVSMSSPQPRVQCQRRPSLARPLCGPSSLPLPFLRSPPFCSLKFQSNRVSRKISDPSLRPPGLGFNSVTPAQQTWSWLVGSLLVSGDGLLDRPPKSAPVECRMHSYLLYDCRPADPGPGHPGPPPRSQPAVPAVPPLGTAAPRSPRAHYSRLPVPCAPVPRRSGSPSAVVWGAPGRRRSPPRTALPAQLTQLSLCILTLICLH